MSGTDWRPTGASRVVLVGMMGAGKTRVGQALAVQLEATFRDSDHLIEAREKQSIPAIFEERGEDAFRDVEREVVGELLQKTGAWVLALGGGAVLDKATREAIVASDALCVWLQAPPDELARQTGDGSRPLLAGLDATERAQKLAGLLDARSPSYAAVANLMVSSGARDGDEVATEIGQLLAGEGVVEVDLGDRSYEVRVGAGGLARLGGILKKLGAPAGRLGVVTDRNVLDPWAEHALRSLAQHGMDPVLAVVPPGEGGKRLAEVERVAGLFTDGGLDRGSWIVGVGGGAVTDVAGFVAATYRRGVPWVACPTTLLGMVDAAVGGKTGVNLSSSKNQVGAFHQPRAVIADVRALYSLPAREVRSGMGEVLKVAMVGTDLRKALVEEVLETVTDDGRLSERRPTALVALITLAAKVKARIVEADERETLGQRKILNFGHTIGHAIEAAAGFGALAHGEAVIHGMRGALVISERLGLLPEEEATPLYELLDRVQVTPVPTDLLDDDILRRLMHDKKFVGGRRLFVLLEGAGRPRVDVEVPEDLIREALARIR